MVKAGELTEEQANAKMAAIKKGAAKSDIDGQLKATWEKLQAGVKAGQLTEEQAKTTMAAIKEKVAKSKQEAEKVRTHLKNVKEELDALVEAGKVSKEDAIKRYEGALKAVRARMQAGQQEALAKEAQEYLIKQRKELAAAVEAGKIREEVAKKMLEGAEKAINEGTKMRAHLTEVKEELEAIFEAGKISREDVIKKYEGALKQARERMGAEQKETGANEAREYLMKVKKGLAAAVEAGKISEQDAAKKYQATEYLIKARMELGSAIKAGKVSEQDAAMRYQATEQLIKLKMELGAAVEAGKISEEDAAKKFEAAEKAIKEKMAAGRSEGGSKRITREDLARAGSEIRKAVAEGKISEEDARAKWETLRKMMADQGARGERKERDGGARPDWEAIKKRIEGAVERGDITRDEADAKYREIREKLAK